MGGSAGRKRKYEELKAEAACHAAKAWQIIPIYWTSLSGSGSATKRTMQLGSWKKLELPGARGHYINRIVVSNLSRSAPDEFTTIRTSMATLQEMC